MAKPIEWRGPATTETKTIPGDYFRLDVCRVPHVGTTTRQPATPSDLVAALAAMGEAEREEVITVAAAQGIPGAIAVRFVGSEEVIARLTAERNEARATAEACRAETRRADAAWAAEERLHKEATARAEKAERERDEARAALAARPPEPPRGCSYTDAVTLYRRDPSADWTCDELQRNHAPDARCRFPEFEKRVSFSTPDGHYYGPYTPTQAEALATDWRRVVAKPEAARPPREYPLAEGSTWVGEGIKSPDGYLTTIGNDQDPQLHYQSGGLGAQIPLLNAAALAHRRGML